MVKDILIDGASGGLLIKDGDLAIGESTAQHQNDLLLLQKGALKYEPLIGVGVADFVDDEGMEDMFRTIRKEYAKDGMKVNELKEVNGELIIDAEYI
jgi:hypothetical protein